MPNPNARPANVILNIDYDSWTYHRRSVQGEEVPVLSNWFAPVVAKIDPEPPMLINVMASPPNKTANWSFDGDLQRLDPLSHVSGLKESSVAVKAKRIVPWKGKKGDIYQVNLYLLGEKFLSKRKLMETM